ncbi:type I restriction-modification system, specificity subunit HdsS [Psychroflexus torquis ATCC 700755]|uniref:Type I restriction-modification system, specificity subunit HdsS n=1 Tax=Psychroflexus torquis (strain ATCC 700755 / CIP 106069 / ACAM 623) TaxID=313595 RepID=K4IBQ6_PSYTT|nr:restriction endonuclease subunit S [Psychroflexus torquis]AFU67874.1 type I restriction-modification system, specificity subunit HdsS [Psychroflexus torquis ATCC 700755]
MPKNWKIYKLSEVTTKIGSGATPRGGKEAYKKFGTSLIRSQNVLDFKFSINGLAFIDEKQASKLDNVTIEENDVLLNITGDSVARVCSVPKEFLPARVNQHVAIVRANILKLDAIYLKYFLLENTNKNMLLTLASAGATRNALTKIMIEDFRLDLPPLPEQTQIANILSAIDDKIENNLAINKTLEDMAMALYKHWFVDFGPFQEGEFIDSELGLIPKGWEVKRLEEVVQVNSNSIKKDKEPKIINYIDIASVKEGWVEEIKTIKYEDAPSRAKRIISDGDIIWSTVRPNRKSRFLALGFSENTIVSTGFVVMSPILISYSYLYLCSCTKDFVDYLVSRATGSSYPAVTGKVFEEYEILIPEKAILDRFSIIVEPMFLHSSSNDIENQTLTNLRDTLLPKLISGEVRLKEFREGIDAEINSA